MKFIKYEDGNHYTEDNRFRIINKRLTEYRKQLNGVFLKTSMGSGSKTSRTCEHLL